jgi:hypothetical protein
VRPGRSSPSLLRAEGAGCPGGLWGLSGIVCYRVPTRGEYKRDRRFGLRCRSLGCVHPVVTPGGYRVSTERDREARIMSLPDRTGRMIHLNQGLVKGYTVPERGSWSVKPDGSAVWMPEIDPPSPPFLPEIVPFVPETGPFASDNGSIEPEAAAPEARIVVRCTPGYLKWARGLADHLGGLTLTQTVCQGLIRLAEGSGYHHKIPTRHVPSNPSRRRLVPRDP